MPSSGDVGAVLHTRRGDLRSPFGQISKLQTHVEQVQAIKDSEIHVLCTFLGMVLFDLRAWSFRIWHLPTQTVIYASILK